MNEQLIGPIIERIELGRPKGLIRTEVLQFGYSPEEFETAYEIAVNRVEKKGGVSTKPIGVAPTRSTGVVREQSSILGTFLKVLGVLLVVCAVAAFLIFFAEQKGYLSIPGISDRQGEATVPEVSERDALEPLEDETEVAAPEESTSMNQERSQESSEVPATGTPRTVPNAAERPSELVVSLEDTVRSMMVKDTLAALRSEALSRTEGIAGNYEGICMLVEDPTLVECVDSASGYRASGVLSGGEHLCVDVTGTVASLREAPSGFICSDPG